MDDFADLEEQRMEIEQILENRRQAIEDDVAVGRVGKFEWAVFSRSGHWHKEGEQGPCLVRGPFRTREAAELARETTVAEMCDDRGGRPYGPSEVPDAYFEAPGRVLRCLREAKVVHEDLITLAYRIAKAGADELFDDTEIPY